MFNEGQDAPSDDEGAEDAPVEAGPDILCGLDVALTLGLQEY